MDDLLLLTPVYRGGGTPRPPPSTPVRRCAPASSESTGRCRPLGASGTKLLALVHLYLRTNSVFQEKVFRKDASPPSSGEVSVFAGRRSFRYSPRSDSLVRISSHSAVPKGDLKLTFRSEPDDKGVDLFLPHVEGKRWRDAVHMRVEGRVAKVFDFFLTTGSARAAMKWEDAPASRVHLWTMRSLEILAHAFGASRLELVDAASTRVSRRTGDKSFVYVDLPNRSAQLKILRDDPHAHTYGRYGFSPVRAQNVGEGYVSSRRPVSDFARADPGSFPLFLYSREELSLPLSEAVRLLLSAVEEELRHDAP